MKNTSLSLAVLCALTLSNYSVANNTDTHYFNQNALNSDTEGNFPATVLFAQNSITPSLNKIEDDIQPHLVAQRKTMLMFKPHQELANDSQIVLSVLDSNDTLVYQTFMRSPDAFTKPFGYDDNSVNYSDNTFSSILPASVIQPNIHFAFELGDKSSKLNNVKVGASTSLIINTIDVGLLTPYRDKFTFQHDADLHRQYFQQVPITKLSVNNFEPLHLTEVMMPDGRLLTDSDPSKGGIYSGDMRHLIAKNLLSHGINNANYGINASGIGGPTAHPYSAAQVTAHNAIGKYDNGIFVHGLSGGAGMVTLYKSVGNEFSHELGHNFGLGHYPGGENGVLNRPADERNSTWGWDGDLDKFIPNFSPKLSYKDRCYKQTCIAAFNGHQYGTGSMSGGGPMYSEYNKYTLHTPYELQHIQRFLENKAHFDSSSKTGFSKWDPLTQSMQPWNNTVLDTNTLRLVNRTPYKQDVPITTIIGFYDPEQQLQSFIYPALHGASGAVYKDSFSSSSCKLIVKTQKAGNKTFNLPATRLTTGKMNKIHINLEAASVPTSASVYCDSNLLVWQELEPAKQNLPASVITTQEKPKACIVNIETNEEFCLEDGQKASYLPAFVSRKPVYVRAPQGLQVMLSDYGNLSYNRIATFNGTVENNKLKNVLAKNGQYLDFSKPRSMRVFSSEEPLGCIVSLLDQSEYCLKANERSNYRLPAYINKHPVYVKAAPGVAVTLSDWPNLSYRHTATFTENTSHQDLQNVKADNGQYLNFSRPASMRVVAN
ncbi:hypothetical protein CWC25_05700 [Pseudoalteromonas sp. S4389]|uniref:M66 family metalloprotease n=1 Tax=Pseudoalteromonas sp. S4389 TaxID=579556 RepID=UPI001109A045|nr:M66 family metalloprotease [Pseudoalteromonas sp. S4389]TMO45608.1 hypothetical protein CWC25_05700 [Pseudoalteromonas sp. S4389]